MRDRNLLLFRFIVANGLAFAGTIALAANGTLAPVFIGDSSGITYGIVALFVVGWVSCAWRVLDLSWALNVCKVLGYAPATHADADKAALKLEWLSGISEWLVGLGLLGTVVGFSMALSGIDQGSVGSADGAQDAVASLMAGMRVALNTTLIGAALGIWHEVNMRLLGTAMGCFWIDRVRANSGEITARGRD